MFEQATQGLGLSASVTKSRQRFATLNPLGKFIGKVIRNGNLIGETLGKNGVTTVGKNHLLDVVFSGGTAVATWYIGLIDNSGFSALLDGDTLASHTGWTEFTTYTGNRQAWVEAAAAAGAKSSSSDATFPITADCTIYGIFLCSAATGTSGTLMATGAFDSPVALENGDNFNVSYTISY